MEWIFEKTSKPKNNVFVWATQGFDMPVEKARYQQDYYGAGRDAWFDENGNVLRGDKSVMLWQPMVTEKPAPLNAKTVILPSMDNKKSLKEQVPSRCYYYLLDFNDGNNWELMREMFNIDRLNLLTLEQFWKLFKAVTEKDYKSAAENA